MAQKFINVMYPTRNVVYGSKVYNRVVRKVQNKDFSTQGWTRAQKDALKELKLQIAADKFTAEQFELLEEERRIQEQQRRLNERRAALERKKAAKNADIEKQQEQIREYMKNKERGFKSSNRRGTGWKLADTPEGADFFTVQSIERRYTTTKKMKDHVYRIFNSAKKAFRITFCF